MKDYVGWKLVNKEIKIGGIECRVDSNGYITKSETRRHPIGLWTGDNLRSCTIQVDKPISSFYSH